MGISISYKQNKNIINNNDIIPNKTNTEVKQLVKLNINDGHISTISNIDNNNFKTLIDVYKLANTGVGQDIIKLLADFTNDEKDNFNKNNYIEFDGDMKLKKDYYKKFKKVRDLNKKTLYEVSIVFPEFKNIKKFSVDDKTLNIKAVPQDQLIIANDYIKLNGIINIDNFNITGTDIKLIVNNGEDWFTYKDNEFIHINDNVEDVSINGIDIDTFNKIPSNDWNNLLLKNKKVRFAYLIGEYSKASELSIQIDLQGYYTNAIAGQDYNINLHQRRIEIKFLKNGSYIVNYL